MIQIYKIISQNLNYMSSDVAPDEDIEIIVEFNCTQDIACEFGDIEKWKGLELVNGQVVFNQARYDAYVNRHKPLAMGRDLKQSLMDYQSDLDVEDIDRIMDKISSLYLTLENNKCNPFTQKQFNKTRSLLNSKFENGTKTLIMSLVDDWAQKVRFAEAVVQEVPNEN